MSLLHYISKLLVNGKNEPNTALIYVLYCLGATCPAGMSMIYGKCVGVVSNTESNDGAHSNCNWNSDSNNYRLAVFGNIKVNVFGE